VSSKLLSCAETSDINNLKEIEAGLYVLAELAKKT
jgi:hypothetical protein